MMQRARESADAATAAAAAATVAPLLQLKRAANKANTLARFARAQELFERALAAAELALPRDSLVIAALLDSLIITHSHVAEDATGPTTHKRMAVKLRLLDLLHTRWQAGTLFSPTEEETAYLLEDEYPDMPAQMCGAFFYVMTAGSVLEKQHLSPCISFAEAEERLHATYGALRAVLEMDARGMLERDPRTGGLTWPAPSSTLIFCLEWAVHGLVTLALSDETSMLLRMRVACGLTAAEETALRQLAERHKAVAERNQQEMPTQTQDYNAKWQQTATADAAQHGLRRCALPSCDAQEPHPKLFKLCGRCHATAYCCKQHQTEDWKRHKRADGCKAA
jgi:hypothetical protein